MNEIGASPRPPDDGGEDALVTTSLDERILSWNPGAERLLGWRAREVLGKPVGFLFPDKHRDNDALSASEALRGAVVRNSLLKVRTRDGATIALLSSFVPIRDAAGDVVGVLRIWKDVSAFKAAQVALERAVRQLRRMDHVQDAFLEAMTGERISGATWDPVTAEGRRARREFLQILADECRALTRLAAEAAALVRTMESQDG